MKLLVDMNLSPLWVAFLQTAGFEAVHWSHLGDPQAHDADLMRWARDHEHVVFTNDLDFSALLAHTDATGPSVVQVRHQDLQRPQWAQEMAVTLDRIAARLERGDQAVTLMASARMQRANLTD